MSQHHSVHATGFKIARATKQTADQLVLETVPLLVLPAPAGLRIAGQLRLGGRLLIA